MKPKGKLISKKIKGKSVKVGKKLIKISEFGKPKVVDASQPDDRL